MPIGHEAAVQIVEIGCNVSDLAIGDHVVINTMAIPSDVIGNGGTTGALADFLLIRDAVRGISLEVRELHWYSCHLVDNGQVAVSYCVEDRLAQR
jgi:L-iditol 2-dehydrogenase